MSDWFNETSPKKPQDPSTDPFAESAAKGDMSIMPVIETPGGAEPNTGFIEQSVEMTQGGVAANPHAGFTAMAAAPHAAQRDATYDKIDKVAGLVSSVGAAVTIKNPAAGGVISAVGAGLGIGSPVGREVGKLLDKLADDADAAAALDATLKMKEQLRLREAQKHPTPGVNSKTGHPE